MSRSELPTGDCCSLSSQATLRDIGTKKTLISNYFTLRAHFVRFYTQTDTSAIMTAAKVRTIVAVVECLLWGEC